MSRAGAVPITASTTSPAFCTGGTRDDRGLTYEPRRARPARGPRGDVANENQGRSIRGLGLPGGAGDARARPDAVKSRHDVPRVIWHLCIEISAKSIDAAE